MDVIKELKEKGCIIIFSSHRMEHVELFCEKLVVLVKGESVLSGSLKEIKKEYQRKNVFIKADIDINELKNIEGVYEVIENPEEYIVKIENEDVIDRVFKYIKICKNVTKFNVEDASLNEIFLNKVGGAYEK